LLLFSLKIKQFNSSRDLNTRREMEWMPPTLDSESWDPVNQF